MKITSPSRQDSEQKINKDSRQNTQIIQDINVRFTVVLGKTKMLIKDVIKLHQGQHCRA